MTSEIKKFKLSELCNLEWDLKTPELNDLDLDVQKLLECYLLENDNHLGTASREFASDFGAAHRHIEALMGRILDTVYPVRRVNGKP